MHFYVSIELNYLVNKRYLKKDEIRKIEVASLKLPSCIIFSFPICNRIINLLCKCYN